MWTNVERAAPVPMSGTQIALCCLAALALAAIARSIPDSYAGMPDGGALTGSRAASVAIADAVALPEPASPTADVRKRSRCPECGTIESMRRIDLAAAAGPPDRDARRTAGVDSGGASAGEAAARVAYELTVRLRDGTTAVFNEATPRAWRRGDRVMVIGGLQQLASR
jgi:hypothetical protein